MMKKLQNLSQSLQEELNSVLLRDKTYSERKLEISTEEEIEGLIFEVGYQIRRRFKHYPGYNFLFYIITIPISILINLIKMFVNLKNGTLFLPVFDFSGDLQMVDQIGRLKIEIYPNDHNPPHFHVKTEHYNIKFTISDCELLKSFTKKEPKSSEIAAIKKWHLANKEELLDIWNRFQGNR